MTTSVVPPATGTILAASTNTITAAWDLSRPERRRELYVSGVDIFNESAERYRGVQQHGTLSTATVSGLAPNTTYFLFVNACASDGCSSYTALGSTITLANAPALPSTFSNVSPASLTVSFEAPMTIQRGRAIPSRFRPIRLLFQSRELQRYAYFDSGDIR